jgi:hypothetical protein
MKTAFFLIAALLAIPTAQAETPAGILKSLEGEARKASPGFAGFSAQRGAQFYRTTQGGDWSCASCHTSNPTATGKHAKTEKPITPLAPKANPERFTDMAKVEKWFKRNCNDVVGRACTAQEKGDVLAYLMTL